MSVGFECKVCKSTLGRDAYGLTKKGARKLTCLDCEVKQQSNRRKKKCGICGATGRLTFFKGVERCDKCLLGTDLMDWPYEMPTTGRSSTTLDEC